MYLVNKFESEIGEKIKYLITVPSRKSEYISLLETNESVEVVMNQKEIHILI